MERLDAGDVAALLDFVAELRSLDDPLPFPPRTLQALRKLVPSDDVGYSVLNPLLGEPVLQVEAGECGEHVVWGADDAWEAQGELFLTLRAAHPVCGYRQRTGDWTRPYKVSDFATQREFHRLPIYDLFYRGEIERWLDVGLPATPDRTRVFIFTRRRGRDYDERDRLVLSLLQPHLQRRAAEAEVAGEVTSTLGMLAEDDDADVRRVVVSTAGGVIEFASPFARNLLRQHLGVANGRLPAGVLDGTKQVFTTGDRRLTVRVVRAGELRILLLDEIDTRLDLLTARERDVLEGVARGRTNLEIALELGISRATVAKHLEHVYAKVGVRTRTAAVTLLGSVSS